MTHAGVSERRVGPDEYGRPCVDGRQRHPLSRIHVVHRQCNYSAFNGYHWTPSDYSALVCECGAYWRTKARYVDTLPDGTLR